MIRSSPVKPSHSAWLNCTFSTAYNGLANRAVRSNTKSWPPMIQNMSKPRRASIDLTRPPAGVVFVGIGHETTLQERIQTGLFHLATEHRDCLNSRATTPSHRNGTVPFDNADHSIMAPAEVYTQTRGAKIGQFILINSSDGKW